MLIDNMIENKREALHQVINNKGLLHKETIEVSEQLDKLITKRMKLSCR